MAQARRAAGVAVAGLDCLSDRGGTGMVGMWKAFEELEEIGWMPRGAAAADGVGAGGGLRADRPRAEHGAEKAPAWENAATIADELRVPRAIGDFLILRAIRASGGTAIAVSD